MTHRFTENDYDPETQSSSARSGGPPRKNTAVGVLDPPGPPHRPHVLSDSPWTVGLTAFLIGAILAIMILTTLFLNR